jgi:cbb3-type cytochrome oxidase subunit 3
MLLGNRITIVLALLLSLTWTGDAIRGKSGLRRSRDGSIVFEEENSNHRRAAHWGGVVDSPPPGLAELRHANGGKKPKGSSDDSDDEELDDPEEREFVFNTEQEEPKKARGKQKGKKGKDPDFETTEIECDDPDDPSCFDLSECDDPDDPLCNPKPVPDQVTDQLEDSIISPPNLNQPDDNKEIADGLPENDVANSGGYNGYNGHHIGLGSNLNIDGEFNFFFANIIDTSIRFSQIFFLFLCISLFSILVAQEPTTMQRALTPFKMSFALSGSLYENDLDDGDYAELVDSTELYLTEYFTSYYQDEPTTFHEVNVVVQKSDDPLIVRFFVRPSFVIPGNVPTMTNLFDRMNDAFSGLGVPEYISILNDMGLGNPFRNTRSIALINETPISVQGSGNSGAGNGLTMDSNDPKFLSLIIGVGVLVLVIGGLFWMYQQRRRSSMDDVHRMELDDVEDQDITTMKKNAFSSKALHTDANTSGYLGTIRSHYRDDSGSKTDLEDASHDPQDDDEMTEAMDNRQTPEEFQETILNSLSYPAPPSDDGSEDGSEEEKTETPTKSSNNLQSEYMNYLDMATSFEEEDLRS